MGGLMASAASGAALFLEPRSEPDKTLQSDDPRKSEKQPQSVAIYHFQMKTVSRSQGRSATAAAAYRSGEKIVDERTGLEHDYSRRSGVMLAEVITPDGQPLNREQLWNAAETAEKRCNSVVAREFVVALPHELNQAQQSAVVKGYAQGLSERTGWAVDVAVHAPGREGDIRNVHAHLLCTTRNVSRDPSGCPVMGSKTREWDIRSSGSELIRSERSEWERCVNQSLEQAHRVERVDCRSHAEKGTDLEPQIHLGVVATGMERKGIQTERGDEHRRIAAHNEKVLEFKAVQNARIDEQYESTRWRFELDKMRQMPLEALQRERAKYTPRSVDGLISSDPAVISAEADVLLSKTAHRSLEKKLGDTEYTLRRNEADMGRYREEHPWKARLHDLRVMPDPELKEGQAVDASLKAEQERLEKALAVSQRGNMRALHALETAKSEAMPGAIREHERQVTYFRDVEAIYQPMKEQHIAREAAQRREQALAKSQEREKEREQHRGQGWSR
jgi:hypothetical protein